MNKPLKDWTLGEIKRKCETHPHHCAGCPVYRSPGGCRLCISAPNMWDLSEPPRWTEQDMKDAKTLKRLIACACFLRRDGDGPPKLYDEDGRFISVLRDCFAALPSETKATLDEIIGGGE